MNKTGPKGPRKNRALLKHLWHGPFTLEEIAESTGYKNADTVAAIACQLGLGARKQSPEPFDPHAPVEDLGAHFALCTELRIAKP